MQRFPLQSQRPQASRHGSRLAGSTVGVLIGIGRQTDLDWQHDVESRHRLFDLTSSMHAELFQNGADVNLYGSFGQTESRGNFFIRLAFNQ